jgi:transcription-repair coupling factor (superfamily II helicase)
MDFKEFKSGNKLNIGGIANNSTPFVLSEFAKNQDKPLLIITQNISEETRLINELNFYNPELNILNFANYEILAYDKTSPHQDIISTRIKCLSQIETAKNPIIITTLESILARISPQNFIKSRSFSLKIGDNLNLATFSEQLINSGYLRVSKVSESGEFSIKGSVVDVFTMGQKTPVRLDMFDDEIDEIRIFDAKTQLSIEKITSLDILPAKEFSFDLESRNLFLENHYKIFNNENDTIYQSVKNNIIPSGIEFYLPLFFTETANLFEYLTNETIICYEKGLSENIDTQLEEFENLQQKSQSNLDIKTLEITKIFLAKDEFFGGINNFHQFIWQREKFAENDSNINANLTLPPAVQILDKTHKQPLQKLEKFLKNTLDKKSKKILISTSSTSRLALLQDLLDFKIKHINNFAEFLKSDILINILTSEIISGFASEEWIILTEENIFGNTLTSQKKRKRAKHKDFDEAIKSLIEIKTGDAIVHENYGVGRYLGLKTQNFDEIKNDFIEIEYAGNSKLLIPIDEISLISRYSGGSDNPPLHKLGSQVWNKAKKKAVEAMRDIASELLKIYAARELETGFSINPPSTSFDEFVAGFGFEETPDQVRASAEILIDMRSEKPMDRLVCGDVGFGKTEIAMRAAFLAVENNTQVAILVPTTLLANQHHKSFTKRFEGFAVNIAALSRFQTAKEQTQVKKDLKNGNVDIVIGTHKLLQNTIEYKNLGLIIIDEEQRFGVGQKEKLKEIRTKCNILTMTATPIPRTLNLALGSLREMSIIATPPKGRVAVQTFISEFSDGKIKEAFARELHRGGQIFFLHNDIDSIDNMAEKISTLMPSVKVRIAHGQMPTGELENIMADFYHGKFQILVCTTIIETGIDIPTANTIIINNAGNFGLSQLHQLRGRVGRSHHKAYAYLLVKSFKSITKDAKKRLDAIESLEELGSGFMLANHDLEIRGAGDILGKNQSGKISEIGFNLYYDLLDRTIKSMKNNKGNQSIDIANPQKISIDLGVSSIIPEDYIFDVHTRLEFYQKIDKVDDYKEVQIEMLDRFGLMPDSCKNMFAKKDLEKLALKICVESINAFNDRVLIKFSQNAKIDFAKIINLIQTQSKTYKLKDQTTLIYYYEDLTGMERIEAIKNLLKDVKS